MGQEIVMSGVEEPEVSQRVMARIGTSVGEVAASRSSGKED